MRPLWAYWSYETLRDVGEPTGYRHVRTARMFFFDEYLYVRWWLYPFVQAPLTISHVLWKGWSAVVWGLAAAWVGLRCVHAVIVHKAHVWSIGRRLQVPMGRLLRHDLSKFSRAEFWPYATYLMAGPTRLSREAQLLTLHVHALRNDHHLEYWLARPGEDVPWPVAREMVADWIAARRRQCGSWPTDVKGWPWLSQDGAGAAQLRQLTPVSRTRICRLLHDALFPGLTPEDYLVLGWLAAGTGVPVYPLLGDSACGPSSRPLW